MSTFTLDTLYALNLWTRDTETLQEKYYYLDVDTLSSTILELIKETEVQKCFSFFLWRKIALQCRVGFCHGGGGGSIAKSCLTLATAWTAARQAPLSMGFCRQEYWSGLPFPSPGFCHTTIQISCNYTYIPFLWSLPPLASPHPSRSSQSARPGSLCYRATSHMTVHKCLVLVNERARIWNKLGWTPECSCLTVLCSSSHRRANLIYIDQKLYTAM